jgi:hypothetical protein
LDDEYRDEQCSCNLLDHAYASRLASERRHVSEARAGENGSVQTVENTLDTQVLRQYCNREDGGDPGDATQPDAPNPS